MKQLCIREWEENNGLINFNWALTRRKKAREIKDKRQRPKTCRNQLEYLTFYWNGTAMSKFVEKLRIKEFSKTLFTSQTIQKR